MVTSVISNRFLSPQLKLLIHRPDPPRFAEVEVELSRKAGRALGLTCVAPVQAAGVYLGPPVRDIVPTTVVDGHHSSENRLKGILSSLFALLLFIRCFGPFDLSFVIPVSPSPSRTSIPCLPFSVALLFFSDIDRHIFWYSTITIYPYP